MNFNKTEAKLLAAAAEMKAEFLAGATHLPVSLNDAGEFVVRVPVIGSRDRNAVASLVNARLGTFEYEKFQNRGSRNRRFWGTFVVTFAKKA